MASLVRRGATRGRTCSWPSSTWSSRTCSAKAALYAHDAAPRLRAMADTGAVPETIRLQIGDSPTTLTVDVAAFQLLQQA